MASPSFCVTSVSAADCMLSSKRMKIMHNKVLCIPHNFCLHLLKTRVKYVDNKDGPLTLNVQKFVYACREIEGSPHGPEMPPVQGMHCETN
jgi:hypothetical protein